MSVRLRFVLALFYCFAQSKFLALAGDTSKVWFRTGQTQSQAHQGYLLLLALFAVPFLVLIGCYYWKDHFFKLKKRIFK